MAGVPRFDALEALDLKKTPGRHQQSSPAQSQLFRAYSEMLRARLTDEKAITLYKQNKCHFQIGVAGHEAVQVAAGHVFRPGQDWFFPYYRDMALCAALGMTSREFMLNCFNKQDDPNSHGRQMPMHYGHRRLKIVSQSSPTGTQFLQAVGVALAIKRMSANEVVYVSSGEGACSQGDFHEALNWAARERLPVVFLIQNNKFAISVHVSEQLAGQSVYKLTAGYENLKRFEIDGTCYPTSFGTLAKAHRHALNGRGPVLIEAHVPRLQSHSISDNQFKYRSRADVEQDLARCPIARLRAVLLDSGQDHDDLQSVEAATRKEIDEAANWAETQADPAVDEAVRHTLAEGNGFPEEHGSPDGADIHLVDALNHALSEEMARDKGVYVLGQDVAHGKGGVFTVTAGLTERFGGDRVFNTQLAESSIVGAAIGMALYGLRPVAEIQFGDYVWTGMMQIRNELAMMRYRSAGDWTCPVVIRIPVGGYIHGGAYHSQNIEATMAHFPGLLVVYPSNATDAKGLLKAAIRSSDPVLFLEHKGLYRQVYARGPEGGQDFVLPLGRARTRKEGSDLTIVTWGAIVNKSLMAAELLQSEGISVEVIDMRTIVPPDMDTVFDSVRKTGRLLVAHEDVMFMGFGAEIAAQVGDQCFSSLDAPVRRVGMRYCAAVPHSPVLEQALMLQNDDIVVAARELATF